MSRAIALSHKMRPRSGGVNLMGFVGATSVLRQEPPLRVNSHGLGGY
ncbi:hypothetical protein [Candidatus Chlorohelix sp.]